MKRILLAALLAAFSCQLHGQTTVTGIGGKSGILVAACGGTITSNTTVTLNPIGQIGSALCTATGTLNQIPLGAHTVGKLRVFATVASGTAGSGVVTVYKNGVATLLTCTLGTSQACSDLSDSIAYAEGDRVMIRVQSTAASGDTLASINATIEVF
jgi:hypothetical protein